MAAISIVSNTLTLMGRKPITSIDDDDWGPVIDAQIDRKFKILLLKDDWNFSMSYKTLAQSTTTSNPIYQFEYPLPADFLKLIEVYVPFTDGEGVIRVGDPIAYHQYLVERNLFSNETSILIRYVSSNINLALTNDAFIQALSYFAASESAPQLMNAPSKYLEYAQQYMYYIGLAKKIDVKSQGKLRTWRRIRRTI